MLMSFVKHWALWSAAWLSLFMACPLAFCIYSYRYVMMQKIYTLLKYHLILLFDLTGSYLWNILRRIPCSKICRVLSQIPKSCFPYFMQYLLWYFNISTDKFSNNVSIYTSFEAWECLSNETCIKCLSPFFRFHWKSYLTLKHQMNQPFLIKQTVTVLDTVEFWIRSRYLYMDTTLTPCQ